MLSLIHIYGIPIKDSRLMYEALKRAKEEGLAISLHEEDPDFVFQAGINKGAVSESLGIGGAMALSEQLMVARDCTLALETGARAVSYTHLDVYKRQMANTLIIFGIVTYATKGVSFGAINPMIPTMIIPKFNAFPTIIIWAVAAIAIVWFIWNKTIFGKNLYAVGGNPEAASVSGISVFKVTMGAFILAGILYGFGSWLECARMVGSGSAAYGQGWEMNAIAACVVGGVSFTGGIGKISGVVAVSYTHLDVYKRQPVCRAGEKYDTHTAFRFSTDKDS